MRGELPWWAADFLRATRVEARGPARGSVVVSSGRAAVRVEGRGFRASEVVVRAPLLSPRRWAAFFELGSGEALIASALFSGYLPLSLKMQLVRVGVRLAPRPSRIVKEPVGCPEETVASACRLIARRFADDPLELLHFRGAERKEVLRRLARSWSAASGPASGPAIGLEELGSILGSDPAEEEARSLLPDVQRGDTFRPDPVLRANLARLYTKVRERAAAVGPRR